MDMEDKVSDHKTPSAQDAMETFATDRVPHEARNREDYNISTPPRATKKSRPTSEAQRDVDERAPAVSHGRPDSNVGNPAIKSEIKKA